VRATWPTRTPPFITVLRPQLIEELKSGWIQWLATFIVLWYLLQWVEWFVFYFRVLDTRIVSDFTPRQQRF
jgi:transmembrane protein 231